MSVYSKVSCENCCDEVFANIDKFIKINKRCIKVLGVSDANTPSGAILI